MKENYHIEDILKIGVPLSILVSSVILFYSYYSESSISFFIALFTLIGLSIFLLEKITSSRIDIPLGSIDIRIVDLAILSGVILLMVTARSVSVGLPLLYYSLIPIIAAFIIGKVLISPTRYTLFEIIAFAIVIRASDWYSAPILGNDPMVHLAIVEYTATFGELIPTVGSYYHWYPVAHLLSAIFLQIAPVASKQSMFLMIGVTASIGIIFIYYFTRRILYNVFEPIEYRQAALIAALLVGIGPWHIRQSGIIIAQTLNLLFLPAMLYLILYIDKRRFKLLIFIVSIAIVATHNLSPFVLGYMIITFGIVQYVLKGSVISSWRSLPTSIRLYPGLVLLILVFIHWSISGLLDIQLSRIRGVFTASGTVEEASSASTLAEEYQLTIADPLLHVGIEQLAFGSIFIIAVLYILDRFDKEDTPAGLILASGITFTMLSLALVAGYESDIIRALPYIVLIVAPVFGYLTVKFHSESIAYLAVIGIVLLLPISAAVAASVGMVHPGISVVEEEKAERIHITSSEEAVITHIMSHDDSGYVYLGDGYMANVAESRALAQGQLLSSDQEDITTIRAEEPITPYISPISDISRTDVESTLIRYEQREETNARFVYRQHYHESYGVTSPDNCSIIYSSRGTQLIEC